ncbi:MAG: DUF481 domain-containing protein [Parvibaculaceae bacterium]|nr:DUF481 domain-containing protein [Parvibaculaceae bacterium]
MPLNHHHLPAIAAMGFSLLLSFPAAAAYELEAANAKGGDALVNAVILAIARKPMEVDDIIADAVRLNPARRMEIVSKSDEMFPGFKERIEHAAANALPETAAPLPTAAPELAADATRLDGWKADVALGAAQVTGNSQSQAVNLDVKATKDRANWHHKLAATADYGRSDYVTNARRYQLTGESEYDLSKRTYTGGILQYTDDGFSGYDYELLEGFGYGYRIYDSKDLGLTVEAGPSLRQQRSSGSGDQTNEIIGRIASDFYWVFANKSKLTNEFSILIGSSNTQTENNLALTAPVADSFSLRASLDVRNNSHPPLGSKAYDTITKLQLVYSLQ